jgi:hypothetical protein
MTRRPLTVLAAAATLVVLLGFAASPFLHHHRATPRAAVTDTRPATPLKVRGITTLATVAATRALACHPTTPTAPPTPPTHGGWCGSLTLTREQAQCPTAMRCHVELLGTVTSPEVSSVVALTVTVEQHGHRWLVTAVSS